MVDSETGQPPDNEANKVIYESFKPEDNFLVGLEKLSNKDRLGSYDSSNNKTILKFY